MICNIMAMQSIPINQKKEIMMNCRTNPFLYLQFMSLIIAKAIKRNMHKNKKTIKQYLYNT